MSDDPTKQLNVPSADLLANPEPRTYDNDSRSDRFAAIDAVLEKANALESNLPQPLAGEVVELEAHIEIPMGLLTERISAAAEVRERDAAEPVVTLESVPPDPSVPIPKHLSPSAREPLSEKLFRDHSAEHGVFRDPDHLVALPPRKWVMNPAREAARVESTMMAGLDGLAVKLRVPFDPNAPLQLHFLPEMFLAAIAQKAKTTHNVIVKKACVDFLEAAASYASRMIVELDRRRITMAAQREADLQETEEPQS